MDYINATPEEKEAWIAAKVQRHIEKGDTVSHARAKARAMWATRRERQAKTYTPPGKIIKELEGRGDA